MSGAGEAVSAKSNATLELTGVTQVGITPGRFKAS